MKVAPSDQPIHVKKPGFFKKYFFEGQALHEGVPAELPPDADFIHKIWFKYRKYLGVLLPESVAMTVWLLTAIRFNWFPLYQDNWELPVVMIVGGIIAGLTAESGGAVAFPYITLVMHWAADNARDFSIIIEANSMLCAMVAIGIMGVRTETRSILFGTLGSIPGLIFGFTYMDQWLTSSQKKMLFVSIWSSFAVALFLLNQEKKRKTFMTIPDFKPWKAAVLVVTGFVGGVLTSFTGSGVDICIFSIITVLFRVSEKSATPTTIVLMGINALVGTYYRVIWVGTVEPEVWDYLKTTIPVVLIVAPAASLVGSHFHRQVLAFFVYVLEAIAVVGFIVTGPPVELLLIGGGIILLGFGFFYTLAKIGETLMRRIEEKEPPKVMQMVTVQA